LLHFIIQENERWHINNKKTQLTWDPLSR